MELDGGIRCIVKIDLFNKSFNGFRKSLLEIYDSICIYFSQLIWVPSYDFYSDHFNFSPLLISLF